jgi:uncharacterized protein CbrC (UPF0167 family)
MFGFKKSVVVEPSVEQVEYVACGVCHSEVYTGLVFPDETHGTMCWYCIAG